MKPLYINGKFAAQSVTGVQRVAHEVIHALDRGFDGRSGMPDRPCVVLCPPGAGARLQLRHLRVAEVDCAVPGLQAWEQLALPRASRDGWLLNLSGSAPWIAAGRSFSLIHDAAVFDRPEAYTLAFKIWYRLLFRRLARRALGLLTVSEFSRQRLGACLGVDAARLHVVRNCADHFLRFEADVSTLKRLGVQPLHYLLVVGTAKQTKNVAAVMAAWRRLAPGGDLRLVWVGGQNTRVFAGPDAQHHDVQRDRADGIIHAGFISDSRLKALYQNAAGLVIGSYYEGFGLPVVEAMICGCPVAAARAAALPEVCGDAALYFDPHDVDSIAAAMGALLADGTRARLGALGLQRVTAQDWQGSARALWDWLQRQPAWTGSAPQ